MCHKNKMDAAKNSTHLVHEMVAAEQPYYYADPEDMLLLPKKMQLSHPTVQDLYIANHDNTEEIILPIK